MFRTVCSDLVKTLCGPNTTAIVGLGQCVMPAGSLNEASQVSVGTFVVKSLPVHFWQYPTAQLMTPLCVNFDKSKGDPTTEVVVLNDIQKEIDMTENNSLNVSALKEVGVNMGVQGAYKMQADLGEIRRIDMKKDCIQDYSVPPAVAAYMIKPGQKRVLAVVTKVFIIPNASTVTLHKEITTSKGLSLSKAGGSAGGENSSGKEQSSSLTMVAGQVVAYCLQECEFDPKTSTFTLPSDYKMTPSQPPSGDATSANGTSA